MDQPVTYRRLRGFKGRAMPWHVMSPKQQYSLCSRADFTIDGGQISTHTPPERPKKGKVCHICLRMMNPLIHIRSVHASCLNATAARLLGDSPVLVYIEGRKVRLVPVGDDPVTMLTPNDRSKRSDGKYRQGSSLHLGTVLRNMGFEGRAHVAIQREGDAIVFEVPERIAEQAPEKTLESKEAVA